MNVISSVVYTHSCDGDRNMFSKTHGETYMGEKLANHIAAHTLSFAYSCDPENRTNIG